MGQEGFGVCQGLSQGLPSVGGQPEEFIKSDSCGNVGQLGHHVELEGRTKALGNILLQSPIVS